MKQVFDRLYTGAIADCCEGKGEWAVVHACRHPCYLAAIERLGVGGESPSHLETQGDLFLDMIDGPSTHFSIPPVEAFLSFASRHWEDGVSILIHCNQGISRSPSLAMLFMAKRLGIIPATSYQAASAAFWTLLPFSFPSAGIRGFLSEYWDQL